MSYLEIYNEEIRDLLVKEYKYKPEIKERPEKGIYVKGLSNITVDSYEDIKEILKSGRKNRSVGSTLMNADSSRSHSIFIGGLPLFWSRQKGGLSHRQAQPGRSGGK